MAAGKNVCIVLMGEAGVGKTSLIRRFLDDRFSSRCVPTVEDVFHKKFQINGELYDVEFLDTSGTYNFPAMRRLAIHKATAFVLVFSVLEESTLDALDDFCNQIREETDHKDLASVLVVAGNKGDIKTKMQVSRLQAEAWMTSQNLPSSSLIMTSAKEEDGVWNVFNRLWQIHSPCKGGGSGSNSHNSSSTRDVDILAACLRTLSPSPYPSVPPPALMIVEEGHESLMTPLRHLSPLSASPASSTPHSPGGQYSSSYSGSSAFPEFTTHLPVNHLSHSAIPSSTSSESSKRRFSAFAVLSGGMPPLLRASLLPVADIQSYTAAVSTLSPPSPSRHVPPSPAHNSNTATPHSIKSSGPSGGMSSGANHHVMGNVSPSYPPVVGSNNRRSMSSRYNQPKPKSGEVVRIDCALS